MGEEWRQTRFPGYEVSSLGRVRSPRGRILKPGLAGRRREYPFVQCGRGNPAYVHTLVSTAWHGPRPTGMQAAHRDGNPLNNTPGNLRWATPKENNGDKVAHGTSDIRGDFRGERNGRAKLTLAEAGAIKKAAAARATTVSELARRYGVSRPTVADIRDGITWKELA